MKVENEEEEPLEASVEQRRVRFKGGALTKVKKRSPKKQPLKIEQALAMQAQRGGALKKVKKRSPKKQNLKIEQALTMQAQRGGSLKFHSLTHKYLYHKLSGRGARHDSPQCRKMMHTIMKNYHPSFWNSYLKGSVHDTPRFENDHIQTTRQPKYRDARADIVSMGGSLSGLSHSENGVLVSHNSEFHHFAEVV